MRKRSLKTVRCIEEVYLTAVPKIARKIRHLFEMTLKEFTEVQTES